MRRKPAPRSSDGARDPDRRGKEERDMADRYALVFEDGRGTLGGVALRLIRLGIDALYSRSVDEAMLLAVQEAPRIRALLFPPDAKPIDLMRLIGQIEQRAPDGPWLQLVAVGPRPGEAERQRLRDLGVGWAVWDPDDDGALRFVVSAALTLPEAVAWRREPRAPTDLLAACRAGSEQRDAIVYTLTARGAFLELARPFPVGERFDLEFPIEGRPVRLAARVLHVNGPDAARRHPWPLGMGVVFEAVPQDISQLLRAYVAVRAERICV
jgi:hypothetical protein